VRRRLIENISKEGQKDGFDGILICFDKKKNYITYTAANNAPILIKNGKTSELVETPCDRMPVGIGEKKDEFKLYILDVQKGDVLYLYTDGYADQFGGPKGKKFMYKRLNEKLISLSSLPLSEQYVQLKNTFNEWKGNLEQVDDVCVIGIKL
jgi:serine phosphatase RsbU (regulator of sigma subunit)